MGQDIWSSTKTSQHSGLEVTEAMEQFVEGLGLVMLPITTWFPRTHPSRKW